MPTTGVIRKWPQHYLNIILKMFQKEPYMIPEWSLDDPWMTYRSAGSSRRQNTSVATGGVGHHVWVVCLVTLHATIHIWLCIWKKKQPIGQVFFRADLCFRQNFDLLDFKSCILWKSCKQLTLLTFFGPAATYRTGFFSCGFLFLTYVRCVGFQKIQLTYLIDTIVESAT